MERPVIMRKRIVLAFTLVELLTVMAVISILIAIVAPTAIQVLKGNNLTQSGEMVSDQFVLARQSALSSNRTVQMRFYQLPTAVPGATPYNAVQCFRMDDNGTATPLTKVQPLKNNIIFSADKNYSSLITPPSGNPTISGTDKIPAYGDQKCNYVGFQFLADGSTDLDPTAAKNYGGWFVTLLDTTLPVPTSEPPRNYYTLRVEALDGHTRLFRP